MKLIYKDPDGRTNRVLFPKVGEWQTGEIREVNDGIAEFLLKHHGAFIHKVDAPTPTPKKKKKPELEVETELVVNNEKEAIEKATEKLEDFYKVETEGGEI